MKNRSLETLKVLFEQEKVLNMKQLCKALDEATRVTVFRYLRQLNHLTSYTHNGKYYTLPSIAQFDANGFLYFGDIGFSVHGTLINTLTHVITTSKAGKTNAELEAHCRTRVQDALHNLLSAKKIARTKPPASRYLYVNADPKVSARQVQKRTAMKSQQQLPDEIIRAILVETIRSFSMEPRIDTVVKRLSKQGSSITREQVAKVFKNNKLNKQTRY